MGTQFAIGSLVRARERDWIVLAPDEPDVLRLRALTGREDEIAGLYLPVDGDDVAPAQFALPDPTKAGDSVAARALHDALRLRLRAGATPFRSAGRLAFTPRAYQYVPLVMALRQDRVRLLIADDVGTGKTIAALLIARELLDRGLIRRIGVLCPAHLCEQWETEMREKFGLDARVLQPSRVARLEREVPRGDVSVLAYFPYLVASIDFMKSSRRDAYVRNAPDLLIVDEAHGSARPKGQRDSAQHQRYEFVRELAGRVPHLILATATPHSGIEENFRSLLGLLDPKFDVPEELELDRTQLQPHIVQRRRRDIERWHGEQTRFPERVPEWATYDLSEGQQRFFERLLSYCRESVRGRPELAAPQQRVRHWAALALLRCALSSPGAAVTMLAGRSEMVGSASDESAEIDDAYRSQVLDPSGDEAGADAVPSAPLAASERDLSDGERRRLGELARLAEKLVGPGSDRKLAALIRTVDELVREGAQPIVFCRYIATATYVADQLQAVLGDRHPDLRISAVTGALGEEVRRKKVEELSRSARRVLVATDCLSEGINLQDAFGAVVHYDLPWNPNRLDQREGRVDRFGQTRPKVRAIVLYGANNPVDLVVLDVLIRKARQIRQTLGFSLPIPMEAEGVLQTVLESVLLQGGPGIQLQLGLMPPEVGRFHGDLDQRAKAEERQRAFFSQPSIDASALANDIAATTELLGDQATLQRFLADAAQRFGGELRKRPHDEFELLPGQLAGRISATGAPTERLRLDSPSDGATLLTRTSPLVETVADAVIGTALIGEDGSTLSRCGAAFTDAVTRRIAVLLLRLRYELTESDSAQFAEEIVTRAFSVDAGQFAWHGNGRDLLERARPSANMAPGERAEHVVWALRQLERPDWTEPIVRERVDALTEAHERARHLGQKGKLEVRPHVPPDVIGCFVFVPAGKA